MSLPDIRNPVFQRLALVAGIASFVIIAFLDSFASMWSLWQTSDHRHGVLVIPISAFLIWRLRDQLSGLPVSPDWRGLLVILLLAIAWMVARLAGIQVVEHVAVLAMIPATVATLAGTTFAGKILFPLLFLFLATPLGESLVPYLMIITADISSGLLKLSGIPVMRDGQYMSLPGGDFVVADVCSGLSYLVSGVMISLLYAYLTYESIKKRLLFVAVTSVAMIITNGVRAYIVMAVASATRMEYLGGRDHVYFGWLLFGIVIMFIMWIGARYADDDEATEVGPSTILSRHATQSTLPLILALGLVMLVVTVMPLQADFLGSVGSTVLVVIALTVFAFLLFRQSRNGEHDASAVSGSLGHRLGSKRVFTVIATVVVFIATPRYASTIEQSAIVGVVPVDLRSSVPCDYLGGWREHWQPRFHGADHEVSATFECSGQQVGVFFAAYASALQGKELVSSSHRITPADWSRVSKISPHRVTTIDGQQTAVREIHVDGASYEGLVWYWYEIDGNVATTPLTTKAYQVLALLLARPAGGRVIVVESRAHGDIQSTRDRLERVAVAILNQGASSEFVGSL